MRRYIRRVRYGLIGTFLAFGAGAGLTWFYREAIFGLLTAPAGGLLSPHGGLPVFTSPTEILSVTLRLSVTGGIVAALPVAVFSVFRLVSPLLTRRDRRTLGLFLPAVLLFYLSGVAFTYFVMLPTGVRFLLGFGEGVAVPTIRISEYLNLVMALMFWLGVIFEIPLVMFLLVKLRVVSHGRLKRTRRYLLLAAPFLGIILTPTFDPLNMLLVSVPIIVLYEAGLLLAWLAQPGKGNAVLRFISNLAIGSLQRLAVVLALAPALLTGLLYVTALALVFVWDGHLSTGMPSKGKAKLDLAYGKARAGIARVLFIRPRRRVWLDCMPLEGPRS